MHDRYLKGQRSLPQPRREALHQYKSIAFFNARLRQTNKPNSSESAAIWVTAILISTIAFGLIEATTPEEAWPLRPASSSDLSWLLIGKGKDQMSMLTETLRTDSQYQNLFPPQAARTMPKSSTQAELSTLPKALIKLCDLDTTPNNNNPYHAAAATLARAINTDYISILLNFFCFIGNTPQAYKSFLLQKDPRALLLLALWYAKLSKPEIWWLQPRTTLEGHAICIYLRRYYLEDKVLQDAMTMIWQDVCVWLAPAANEEPLS